MTTAPSTPANSAQPEVEPEPKSALERVLLVVFVVLPFLAVLAAVPLAWAAGWLGWTDVVLRHHRARGDCRLPPLLHARLVQGETTATDRTRGRLQPVPGDGDH
jgi:hypothetical protein